MADDCHAGDSGADGAFVERPRAPRWARLCVLLGLLLMLASGGVLVAAEALISRYEGSVGKADLFGDQAAGATQRPVNITGPLNILLVGIDPRAADSDTPPLADSILILHVPAGLDRAYLFSLPRDLIVDIPRFDKARYLGGTDRLNAAMAYGSHVPGRVKPDATRGFELLSMTISNYTGIKRFDAGAIINFTGFRRLVDAMGGVTMYVDAETRSEHRRPDGRPRPNDPDGEGYVGPQAVYEKGRQHLEGWQALDYLRQRKSLADGDYGRQRHQQQFIKAMVDRAFGRNVVTNPVRLDAVLRSAGRSLIFNGRGNSIADFGFALRGIRSDAIMMIKLSGVGVAEDGEYRGERLEPPARQFFTHLAAGRIDTFVAAHPDVLNRHR